MRSDRTPTPFDVDGHPTCCRQLSLGRWWLTGPSHASLSHSLLTPYEPFYDLTFSEGRRDMGASARTTTPSSPLRHSHPLVSSRHSVVASTAAAATPCSLPCGLDTSFPHSISVCYCPTTPYYLPHGLDASLPRSLSPSRLATAATAPCSHPHDLDASCRSLAPYRPVVVAAAPFPPSPA
ncbi:hypothetical protein CRG98_016110 [Punica granatum]|uniref:Uncharacterized protein n=1 Tax=Punica granatum TaxID=22663 RepID=A0A2I0K5L7_PUNGR|nr:hypothetical protein CRG98_016110 [Punica granatum]